MISGTSEFSSKSGPGDLRIITKMAQNIQETYGFIFNKYYFWSLSIWKFENVRNDWKANHVFPKNVFFCFWRSAPGSAPPVFINISVPFPGGLRRGLRRIYIYISSSIPCWEWLCFAWTMPIQKRWCLVESTLLVSPFTLFLSDEYEMGGVWMDRNCEWLQLGLIIFVNTLFLGFKTLDVGFRWFLDFCWSHVSLPGPMAV